MSIEIEFRRKLLLPLDCLIPRDKMFGRIYALKALTNKLCLKMYLHPLKMKEYTSFYDHLNKFNRLVFQLLSISTDKVEDE